MSKFAPKKWKYEKLTPYNKYYIYEEYTEIASVEEEKYVRLIASAPELYWIAYNLLFELKRGEASNPEYVKQVIPQIEDLLNRIHEFPEELKPCPFCGGIAGIFTGYSGCEKVYRIECTQCRGRSRENELKSTVIQAWNKREGEVRR